jgi:hypothetical protein
MHGMSVLLLVSGKQYGLHLLPCCVDRSFAFVSWTRQKTSPGCAGFMAGNGQPDTAQIYIIAS